ncbi:MAG: hypothetical protein ABIK09_06985, partial [Pseudomonadota bacterium]
MSRFHSMVLCAVIVFTGCGTGNGTPNSEDVATDGPPVSQDTLDQSAPETGPDEEPPVWSEYAYLKAYNVGPYYLQLIWGHEQEHGNEPVTDNVGVATYAIYQNGVMVGEMETGMYGYLPEGIQPDTVYLFQVQAGDAAGNWSTDGPSDEVKTECPTFADDKCPVSWPPDSVLAAEPTGDTSVLLTWTPAYDNMEV